MRHTSSLPFELWPKRDRELWVTTVASTEDWLDQTRAAGWAHRTRDEAMKSYGRWLRWLQDHDRLDPVTPPTHRVVPELVRRFITDELIRIRASTLSNVLFHLAGIVTSFAPGEDWAWLYGIRSRLKCKASREPRTRPRIVPAPNLFDLGIELMREATESQSDDDIDIDRFLDGLLLALLISVYLRITDFTQLELGRHLERGPDRWRLQIAGDLTKTGQADNSLLPVTLTPWIDLYVNVVRPRLTLRCHVPNASRFWLGLDGRPLSGHLIRKRIKACTKEAFGFAICPHAFRKIAATTFILERPEYALHGPALLGHRSADTIHKHYFVSQQQLAIRTYHNLRDSRRSDDRSGASATGNGTLDRQIKALLVCASSPPGSHRTRRPRQRD
jgi:integrase/recombinase XerD